MAIITGTPLDDVLNGTNKADTIYGLEGSDTIHGLQGDDKIVGELEELRFIQSAITGDITDTIPVFGSDNLFGDQGNDWLYGDIVKVTFKAEAATSGSKTVTGISITFAGDTLDGDMGNDTLIGDAGEILLSSLGGGTLTTPVTTTNSSGLVSFNTITTGEDTLWGGNGVDVLYGDIALLRVEAISGVVDGPATQSRGRVVGNHFDMVADELHGGTESDTLYGDIGTLELFGQGGTSKSSADSTTAFNLSGDLATPNVFTMGWDQLYGDEGNDFLVGDIGILTIQGLGGSASGSNATASTQVTGTFFMGEDTLDGGNGNDTLWGDVANISVIGKGNIVSGGGSTADGLAGSRLTMGVDTLIGGEGIDHLYGDVDLFSVSYTAGVNSSTLAGVIGSTTNTGARASAGTGDAFPIVFNGGIDNLVGGSGDDFLYGDVGTLSISMTGGTNSGSSISAVAAATGLFNSTFAMENDTLDGGSGNDFLYGDLGDFSATLTPGTGSGTTPQINNTKIQFGNDTLIGGSGDDILVGDIADPTQLAGFLNAPLSSFILNPPIANQLIFGNDTFEFSLGGANGNDTIKDMNVGAVGTATCTVTIVNDTLKFTDVMDVNGGGSDVTDVDAQVSFSNSGGHLLMSFSGGSVLFENIDYAGQTSVTDITPVSNIVVI